MSSELQDLFWRTEPEMLLESFSVTKQAIFRLVDCDANRVGRLICEDVYVLCVTAQWESYSAIAIFSKLDIDSRLSWLSSAMPDGYRLVVFQVSEDSADESALPLFAGERLGYIICKSVNFVREREPAIEP